MKSLKYEGYWYNSSNTNLPNPKPKNYPVEPEFLEKLKLVQKLAEKVYYRGWSMCRCCDKVNGSFEYEFRGWVWPEGYEHYLVEHNVHPTPEFRQMVELV
jgi:hypothetical protein